MKKREAFGVRLIFWGIGLSALSYFLGRFFAEGDAIVVLVILFLWSASLILVGVGVRWFAVPAIFFVSLAATVSLVFVFVASADIYISVKTWLAEPEEYAEFVASVSVERLVVGVDAPEARNEAQRHLEEWKEDWDRKHALRMAKLRGRIVNSILGLLASIVSLLWFAGSGIAFVRIFRAN